MAKLREVLTIGEIDKIRKLWTVATEAEGLLNTNFQDVRMEEIEERKKELMTEKLILNIMNFLPSEERQLKLRMVNQELVEIQLERLKRERKREWREVYRKIYGL